MECRECKSSIPDGALKCVKCDAYQDWRKFTQFSAMILSLLIALLSVSGVVIPYLINSLKGYESNISVNLGGVYIYSTDAERFIEKYQANRYNTFSGDRITFHHLPIVVSNSGSADGAILAADISGFFQGDTSVDELPLYSENGPVPVVVKANETVKLDAFVLITGESRKGISRNPFQVTLTIADSNGEKRKEIHSVSWDKE